jgi:hypothetical protein
LRESRPSPGFFFEVLAGEANTPKKSQVEKARANPPDGEAFG